MTEDSAKTKLTLTGKKTLTLKGLGEKASSHDGKKVVQVEVRKKRVIASSAPAENKEVQLDEATQAKLRLIAEAKEHEAKRQQQEEEKQLARQKLEEEIKAEKQRKEEEEAQRLALEEQKIREAKEAEEKAA